MKANTTELQAKIDNGAATETEQVIYKLLNALGDITPEEAAQKLLQAEAVCDAKDQGRLDIADALLALFSDGDAIARRTENGFEFRLTDVGMEKAAALVRSLAAGKLN